MTALDDALWVGTIIISLYLTLFLIPLGITGVTLLVSGRMTMEWIHASGWLLMIITNIIVFPVLLFCLWRHDRE